MISVFQLEHLDQQVKGQESEKLKIQFISVWFQWFASFNDYRIFKKKCQNVYNDETATCKTLCHVGQKSRSHIETTIKLLFHFAYCSTVLRKFCRQVWDIGKHRKYLFWVKRSRTFWNRPMEMLNLIASFTHWWIFPDAVLTKRSKGHPVVLFYKYQYIFESSVNIKINTYCLTVKTGCYLPKFLEFVCIEMTFSTIFWWQS